MDIPINPNCSMYYFWQTSYGRSLAGEGAWTTYWVHSDVKDDPDNYNRHMKWKYEANKVPITTSKDTLELLASLENVPVDDKKLTVSTITPNLRTRMKIKRFQRRMLKAWKIAVVKKIMKRNKKIKKKTL